VNVIGGVQELAGLVAGAEAVEAAGASARRAAPDAQAPRGVNQSTGSGSSSSSSITAAMRAIILPLRATPQKRSWFRKWSERSGYRYSDLANDAS
jgi:hypothetical protein